MFRDEFLALALRNPVNVAITDALVQLALPDAWLVAGCLVQTAWNELTGRPIGHGIADYDVFYFDPDTSWEAEDAVIRTLHARLGHLGAKIEIRNQARVHLWYPAKHGLPYPPLTRSTDGIEHAIRSEARRRRFRRRCAPRVRRRRGVDRAPESRAELFHRQLRSESRALEGAVA